MAKITIQKKSKPYCLWCDSTKPATKAGWVERPLTRDFTVYFCSKKCLTTATVNGRGEVLDVCKIAARQKQKERKAVKVQFQEIIKKNRMDEEDYAIFFQGMSAKQKQALALMGLGGLIAKCFRNPKKILAEIDRLK
jgi:hypothetical protein